MHCCLAFSEFTEIILNEIGGVKLSNCHVVIWNKSFIGFIFILLILSNADVLYTTRNDWLDLLPAGGTTWSSNFVEVLFQIFLITTLSSSLAWSMFPGIKKICEYRLLNAIKYKQHFHFIYWQNDFQTAYTHWLNFTLSVISHIHSQTFCFYVKGSPYECKKCCIKHDSAIAVKRHVHCHQSAASHSLRT